jgi:hypothetical protein
LKAWACENTVAAYTSDHGNHFKTRSRIQALCQDSCIRIPMAAGPGLGRADRWSAWRSPATLLDAAGIAAGRFQEIQSCRWCSMMRRLAEEVYPNSIITGGAGETPTLKYATAPGWMEGVEIGALWKTSYDLQVPHELRNLVDHEAYGSQAGDARRPGAALKAARFEPVIEEAAVKVPRAAPGGTRRTT